MFIETSALTDNNVTQAFIEVGKEILKKLEDKTIDPNIEEFGVKQPSRAVEDLKKYETLKNSASGSGKKKKKGCC